MRWVIAVAVLGLVLSQYLMSFIYDTDVRVRLSVAAAVISVAIDAVVVISCYKHKNKAANEG